MSKVLNIADSDIVGERLNSIVHTVKLVPRNEAVKQFEDRYTHRIEIRCLKKDGTQVTKYVEWELQPNRELPIIDYLITLKELSRRLTKELL